MWVSIMGAPGAAKQNIAELLKEFDLHQLKLEGSSQLAYYLNRLTCQKMIEEETNDRDIVTIGSVWEAVEVYARVARDRKEISDEDWRIIYGIYKNSTFIPPHAVIHSCPVQMTSYNKMMLDGENTIDQEYFSAIVSAYENLVKRIAIPLVKIERIENINDLRSDVEFSLASLKSSGLGTQSFWKRTMFKE